MAGGRVFVRGVMKVLIPPSETKRAGGSGEPLNLDALVLPSLTSQRESVIGALVSLAGDPDLAQRVLKLSTRQLGDIEHNRTLLTAATMPAVDRYTGVLYDALDAVTLSDSSRAWMDEHVWIHSAPFGPVAALDGIPAYRLAAGTTLPGMIALRRLWADATSAAMAAESPAFVLDLRSEAYVALGPVPASVCSMYVRVVTPTGRALNHFNKKAKGALVRALAEDAPTLASFDDLLTWAAQRSIVLRAAEKEGTAELVVAV